jgi:hypothetical protein
MVSTYSRALREGVYRGVIQRHGNGETAYVHQLFSVTGRSVDVEYEGPMQGLMQFLRRWAPEEYAQFKSFNPHWGVRVTDEQRALILCSAERRWIRSEAVHSVSLSGTGITMKSRLDTKRVDGIQDYAMRVNWPDIATG